MGAIEEGEVINGPSSLHDEERIFVSVRMRPLSQKEIDRNDISDWECINDKTILYRNSLPASERSMYPTAYTFDRVFRSDCSTRQVYEEGAKEVALSIVSGINASVFAYGQTSSGKTYTMTGITEHTIKDLYDYIEKHKEREFFLKFSAMEIYNESVRDLLSEDSTPLRLLDDPERGTIVEKLTEESLKDWNHFQELSSICEAQRQIGETVLNEASSRSHQILRLTIESSAREFSGKSSPSILCATVNFVDLAGSERASQSLSDGVRLKEGFHINRSLLTLGTVVRKLRVFSKGRNGHIPFRDSKLTRILQSSLGGNARTAIICTLSPARSHVEQSRNTLLFASCAKEVATNAQVNVVMSDKALVKHLQKELARLESELRNPGPAPASDHSASALLSEKDLQIAKLKEEIADIAHQRDLAKSEAEALRRQSIDSRPPTEVTPYPKLRVRGSWENENTTSDILTTELRSEINIRTFDAFQYSDGHSGIDSESRLVHVNDFEDSAPHSHPSPQISIPDWSADCRGTRDDGIEENGDEHLEDFCKEVRCIEVKDQSMDRPADVGPSLEEKEGDFGSTLAAPSEQGKQETRPEHEEMDNSSDAFVDDSSPKQPPSVLQGDVKSELIGPRNFRLFRSRSCKASFSSNDSFITFDAPEKNRATNPSGYERDYCERPEGRHRLSSALKHDSFENTQNLQNYSELIIEDECRSLRTDSTTDQRCLSSCYSPSETDNKNMAGQEKSAAQSVEETESKIGEPEKHFSGVGLDPIHYDPENPKDWIAEFKRLQKDVIRCWNACNVSLAHRTYFFLLFKGSPTDKVYMETELERLSLIKQRFTAQVNGQTLDVASSSLRDLRQERQMLRKQLQKKLTRQEREKLFQSWDIDLSTKHRSLRLADRLWTNTEDMDHVARSAQVVANLMGFVQPEQHSSEMYGCDSTPRRLSGKTSWWKSTVRSLL